MGKRKNIQTTNIRFNLDDERQRYAWQLLQDRNKKEYSSYSQAVISALIELLKKPEAKDMPPEVIFEEKILPKIKEAVEETVGKAIESTLPSFLAGYMACIGINGSVKAEPLKSQTDSEEILEDWNAEADIDFDFLGIE